MEGTAQNMKNGVCGVRETDDGVDKSRCEAAVLKSGIVWKEKRTARCEIGFICRRRRC